MNVAYIFSFLILGILLPVPVKCFLDLSRLKDAFYSVVNYDKVKCKYEECCDTNYVDTDVDTLDHMLRKDLFGQQIAHQTVVNALRGHVKSPSPPKALSMSFHGMPGTGKTFVAQMIAKSFFRNGIRSKFYHFFNGRNDFPLEEKVQEYKDELSKTIVNSLQQCETSLFVFDEVDKMPKGLLNALVPFLDYNPWHRSWRYSNNEHIPKNKAIYIFLSNTGSTQIVRQLLSLWEKGKQRAATKLQDFENLIALGAFNEKGGLHHSEAIESSAIDHYVPFLPLEEGHVKECLKRAFRDRSVTPTEEMIEEAMSHVTFGPPPHNLYSNAGCKRIEQKVASIIYSNRRKAKEL